MYGYIDIENKTFKASNFIVALYVSRLLTFTFINKAQSVV